jgi:rfaE bifunctional protein nucleotidyltransferase chain/domain
MTIAFCNGIFDVLHPGHINLLSKAKDLADTVIVAIDSDARATANKRIPIFNQLERREILLALKYVDKVHIFGSDQSLINIIKCYAPDYMIKGSDYKDKPIIGAELCKEIIFVERTNDSTTKIIQRIANR